MQVEDNGIGMTNEEINQLKSRMEEKERMEPLGVGGLGISNTYIRLKEFLGPTFQFDIRHGKEGGLLIELSDKPYKDG